MASAVNQTVPPIAVLLDVAEAAADLNRLLAVDGVWTSAESAGELSDDDRGRLADLGERIDAELATIDLPIARIRAAFSRYPDWFNARIAEGLTNDALSARHRAEAPGKLAGESGDYVARALALADSTLGQLTEERSAVQRKVRAIRGTGPVETDISAAMACGVGTLASMGAMAAGVGLGCGPLFAAGAVGLGAVIICC